MNITQRKKQFNKQNYHRGMYWPSGYGPHWALFPDKFHCAKLVCTACIGYHGTLTRDQSEVGNSCPICHGKGITNKPYLFRYLDHRRVFRFIGNYRKWLSVQPDKRRYDYPWRLAAKQYAFIWL